MRVSVAMINYNYGSYLADAINSVLSQTRPADEVILVDDGSTDESADVVSQYRGSVTEIIQQNLGVAAATNAAIKACTGDVVVLLDSDDLMAARRIERLVETYELHPTAGWVWHELLQLDRASVRVAESEIGRGPAKSVDVRTRARAGRRKLGVPAPATSGLSFRRPLLDELLPMPRLVRSQDGYLKFAALALAPGVVIQDLLGVQGLHDSNSFGTLSGVARERFRAENAVAMAAGWALHPSLQVMADRFVGDALVLSRGGRLLSAPYRDLARSYVSQRSMVGKATVAYGGVLELGRTAVREARGLARVRRAT